VSQETFQELGAGLIARLDPDRRKEISARLNKMIDYAIKRQDWYEEQRNKALSLGIALLGLASFLVAGLLNSSVKDMPLFRSFAAVTLFLIIATAAGIIWEYISGAKEDYTHRELADIRSWFFTYVVKEPVVNAAIFDVNRKAENRKVLVEAWKKFIAGWMEYESHPNGFVTEDLQQVFILYLFQAMRRRSLRRMTKAAYIGAIAIFISLIPTILFAALRA
jgi:hypothetical protein